MHTEPSNEQVNQEEIETFTREWETSDLGHVNLAVLGGTGVGKSTLINQIFGQNLAPTGIGRPVTRGVDYYPGELFGLYDFQGVENFDVLENFVRDFKKIYAERIAADPESAIHAVWYCIKASDLRFDDQQEKVIKLLAEMGLPVVLVMTRTPFRADVGLDPNSLEFLQHLQARHLPVVTGGAVPVAALGDPWARTEAFGLTNLINVTLQALPDGQQAAFSAAQRIDDSSKSVQAHRVAALASVSAAGVAATPIPLADAPLLIGLQGAMMSKIAKLYQVELTTSNLAAGVAGIAATQAGRTLASSLLKAFPGVGNAINAGVAASITLALGKAWIELCQRDWRGDISLKYLAEHGELAKTLLQQYNTFADKARGEGPALR